MRSHHRTIPRGFAAIAAAGLLLTACSSGSSKAATSSTKPRRATTTSSRTPTTTKPGPTDGSSTTTARTPAGSTPTTPAPTSSPPPTPDTCGGQRQAITAALLGGDLGSVPIGSYTITDCRTAPSNPIWAAVNLQPNPGQSVTPLIVVLQRIGSIWTVHAYGQSRIGCDAPAPVPAELRLGC